MTDTPPILDSKTLDQVQLMRVMREASQQLAEEMGTPDSGTCGSAGGCDTADTASCADKSIDLEVDDATIALPGRLIRQGFYNALEVCFNQLQSEPKHILVLGGCRQIDMARRLGFLLPYSKITVVDPEQAIVAQAEDAIRCRFDFVHDDAATLAKFSDNSMDLVLAHNLDELSNSNSTAQAMVSALQRVVRSDGGAVMVSTSRAGMAWPWVQHWPGVQKALGTLGCQVAYPAKNTACVADVLEPQVTVQPYPWTLMLKQY